MIPVTCCNKLQKKKNVKKNAEDIRKDARKNGASLESQGGAGATFFHFENSPLLRFLH